MIVWLFQNVFSKVIGLDRIPKEKKKKAAEFAERMAKEAIKAYAEGTAEGITDGIAFKIKKEF